MISVAISLAIALLAALAAGAMGYLLAQRVHKSAARAIESRLQEAESTAISALQAKNELADELSDWKSKQQDVEAGRQERPLDAQAGEVQGRRERLLADRAPEREALKVLLDSMQRLAVDYTAQATSAVVSLPSEDVKGRIIGREGRNIRAFEQVTGTDLIIDETPETVVISSFDPVRREVARLTLLNLILDGRIHPGRIEELFAKAHGEVDLAIKEAGQEAALRAGVPSLPFQVTDVLGRLKFRFSYGQNVLDHSVEVAQFCQLLAQELGLNVEAVKRAGLLHDVGKALGPEWEDSHAIAGMRFLKSQGESDLVAHAVGAHHQEIEIETAEDQIVLIADAVSAARPGARREPLDQFVKRLSKLEEVANAFPGVDRSYAIQAGRELRVIVRPDEVDDEGLRRLADGLAHEIESTLQYPGQIKVTVIRETRAERTAK